MTWMWAGMWAYLSDIDIQNIPHQLTELASEMPILRSVVIGFGLILSSILTALYILQEKIIYLPTIPTREYERTPEDYGLRYVDVEIVTEDDVKLHGWLILQEEDNAISRNRPTFLYMHGNAGNISHRLPDARFYHASGFNVLMLSYRGYGCSEGSPSEPGFKKDAEAALTYLMDRGDVIDTDRLFVFGRSIGGAVAIALASSESGNGNDDGEDRIKGLVVENTFTCINDMINEVFPILRFVKPLNRNKWNSLSIIKDIKIPILFLSGLKDELVPPEHMRKLVEAAKQVRFKQVHNVDHGSHNDTWRVGSVPYRTAIREFVQKVEQSEKND